MHEDKDDRLAVQELFKRIKADLPVLEELLAKDTYGCEDLIYRFYLQSFKVYWLQGVIEEYVAKLQSLSPERPLNEWFMQIIHDEKAKVELTAQVTANFTIQLLCFLPSVTARHNEPPRASRMAIVNCEDVTPLPLHP